jgi:hypothetical protein
VAVNPREPPDPGLGRPVVDALQAAHAILSVTAALIRYVAASALGSGRGSVGGPAAMPDRSAP